MSRVISRRSEPNTYSFANLSSFQNFNIVNYQPNMNVLNFAENNKPSRSQSFENSRREPSPTNSCLSEPVIDLKHTVISSNIKPIRHDQISYYVNLSSNKSLKYNNSTHYNINIFSKSSALTGSKSSESLAPNRPEQPVLNKSIDSAKSSLLSRAPIKICGHHDFNLPIYTNDNIFSNTSNKSANDLISLLNVNNLRKSAADLIIRKENEVIEGHISHESTSLITKLICSRVAESKNKITFDFQFGDPNIKIMSRPKSSTDSSKVQRTSSNCSSNGSSSDESGNSSVKSDRSTDKATHSACNSSIFNLGGETKVEKVKSFRQSVDNRKVYVCNFHFYDQDSKWYELYLAYKKAKYAVDHNKQIENFAKLENKKIYAIWQLYLNSRGICACSKCNNVTDEILAIGIIFRVNFIVDAI
jgi:hypothetical protein